MLCVVCVCVCVVSAAFDDDQSCITGSGRIDFSEGNRVVASAGGSHSVVLLNKGGFKSGKVHCHAVVCGVSPP